MEKIIFQNKLYSPLEYALEKEFEEEIIKHANEIFGEESLYIDVKKKIGVDNIVTIPDGYLIDFSFQKDPKLYIIENELVKHDPYKHIGQQLLKFAISYKESWRKIKKFLLDYINQDKERIDFVTNGFINAGYPNIDAFLEELIFEKPIAAIVIIDSISPDLENVLSQLTLSTDILEFRTYICGEDKIHKYTPFQEDILTTTESGKTKLKIEDLDTIVVPAREDGFNEVFLGENCWYAIRISSSMIGRIKYIAGYQVAPISAITYVAEVERIEKYKDTNKYIVFFKEPSKKIGPIKYTKRKKGLQPQAPRYTNFKKMSGAKTLDEVF